MQLKLLKDLVAASRSERSNLQFAEGDLTSVSIGN